MRVSSAAVVAVALCVSAADANTPRLRGSRATSLRRLQKEKQTSDAKGDKDAAKGSKDKDKLKFDLPAPAADPTPSFLDFGPGGVPQFTGPPPAVPPMNQEGPPSGEIQGPPPVGSPLFQGPPQQDAGTPPVTGSSANTAEEKNNKEKDNKEKDNKEKDNKEKDNKEKDNNGEDVPEAAPFTPPTPFPEGPPFQGAPPPPFPEAPPLQGPPPAPSPTFAFNVSSIITDLSAENGKNNKEKGNKEKDNEGENVEPETVPVAPSSPFVWTGAFPGVDPNGQGPPPAVPPMFEEGPPTQLVNKQDGSPDAGAPPVTGSFAIASQEKNNKEKDNKEKDNKEKDNKEKDNKGEDVPEAAPFIPPPPLPEAPPVQGTPPPPLPQAPPVQGTPPSSPGGVAGTFVVTGQEKDNKEKDNNTEKANKEKDSGPIACSIACTINFSSGCMKFHCDQGAPDFDAYAICRSEVDRAVGPLSLSCMPGCEATAEMLTCPGIPPAPLEGPGEPMTPVDEKDNKEKNNKEMVDPSPADIVEEITTPVVPTPPAISGFELCKTTKSDGSTSNIWVPSVICVNGNVPVLGGLKPGSGTSPSPNRVSTPWVAPDPALAFSALRESAEKGSKSNEKASKEKGTATPGLRGKDSKEKDKIAPSLKEKDNKEKINAPWDISHAAPPQNEPDTMPGWPASKDNKEKDNNAPAAKESNEKGKETKEKDNTAPAPWDISHAAPPQNEPDTMPPVSKDNKDNNFLKESKEKDNNAATEQKPQQSPPPSTGFNPDFVICRTLTEEGAIAEIWVPSLMCVNGNVVGLGIGGTAPMLPNRVGHPVYAP